MNKQPQILRFDPSTELTFNLNNGTRFGTDVATSKLHLENPSDRIVYFNIKTNAPKQYCVLPNSGILRPASSVEINVLFHRVNDPVELEVAKHKFRIESAFAANDVASAEILLTAEEIASALLKRIKYLGEQLQKKTFDGVVVTVPAAFSQAQKVATLEATKLAGFSFAELLPEPVAAAFAYFAEREIPNNSTLFLFDLGGGTLDVCIFKIQNNQIHIISNTGDTRLGGRDFDTILINYCKNVLQTKYNISVIKEKRYKLMQHCEIMKEDLSYLQSVNLDVEDMDPTHEGIITISREEFKTMSKELLERIKNTIHSALFNSGLKANEIDKILLVGGGSKIPMVEELLKNIFPSAEHSREQNPDEVVAVGAAYYAYSQLNQPENMPVTNFATPMEDISEPVHSPQYDIPIQVNINGQNPSSAQFRHYDDLPDIRCAVAIFDYEKQEEDEIGFHENDVITDIEQIDEGWWRGILNGRKGLFPSNYVKLI